MRALVAKPRSSHIGEPCRLCTNTIKEGQAILVDTVNEIRFGTGKLRRFHTKCMRDLLAKAPDGVDEVEAKKELILATGNPFV